MYRIGQPHTARRSSYAYEGGDFVLRGVVFDVVRRPTTRSRCLVLQVLVHSCYLAIRQCAVLKVSTPKT